MYPSKLKYSREHTWFKIEDNNTGRLGITHFGQQHLMSISFIELPVVGSEIKRNESCCVVESSKTTSELLSPVSGRVIAVNSILESKPGLVHKDPYGEGWMVSVELSHVDEVNELLTADEYLIFINE
jgi:glycine cleavage system H protein